MLIVNLIAAISIRSLINSELLIEKSKIYSLERVKEVTDKVHNFKDCRGVFLLLRLFTSQLQASKII
jgi:hypothetical protein